MKGDMPPLALPKQEYMERAKKIWERLGLPALRPQAPWFGYSLGDWLPQWDEARKRAATGRYLENGRISEKQRRKGLKPETKFLFLVFGGQVPSFTASARIARVPRGPCIPTRE